MHNRAIVRGLITLIPVALTLLIFGCASAPKVVQEGPITSQTIVATIDTTKITLGDVLVKYAELTTPGVAISATLENALNEVIYRVCAYLGADDYRDFDKSEVDRTVKNRARDVIITYMIKEMFKEQAQVSASSIDSTYRANIDQLKTPELRRVTHLLVSTNPKAWEADGIDVQGLTTEQISSKAKAQVEKYYQEVKGGADLGELAEKYSHDTSSKPKRGDSGLFGRGSMVDQFEQMAFKLSKGVLSPPFKSNYGWHILRVEEIVDSTVTPLDSAMRFDIEQQLKSKILNELARHFADSVTLAAKVVWNEQILQQQPDQYDQNDWVMIVNETDTMNAGVLRELELMYRTGGTRKPITPDIRKEILLNRMPGLALIAAARHLGYMEHEPMKATMRDFRREEVVNCMFRGRGSVSDKLPTDEELRQYYERHKENYISDKPLKVQQVLLPDSLQAAEVRRQAEKGANFKELAEKYNPPKPLAKETEFDLGWISDKDVSPEFFGAGWIADVGKFTGPVQTRWGWHVIKVTGHVPMLSFESARLEVQRALRQERLQQAQEKWAKGIMSGFDIVKYEEILSQVDLQNRDRYFELADSLARAKAAMETAPSGS